MLVRASDARTSAVIFARVSQHSSHRIVDCSGPLTMVLKCPFSQTFGDITCLPPIASAALSTSSSISGKSIAKERVGFHCLSGCCHRINCYHRHYPGPHPSESFGCRLSVYLLLFLWGLSNVCLRLRFVFVLLFG